MEFFSDFFLRERGVWRGNEVWRCKVPTVCKINWMEFYGSVSMNASHTHAFTLFCLRSDLQSFGKIRNCFALFNLIGKSKSHYSSALTHTHSLRLILFMRHTSNMNDAHFSLERNCRQMCRIQFNSFRSLFFGTDMWKWKLKVIFCNASRMRDRSEERERNARTQQWTIKYTANRFDELIFISDFLA